MTYPRRNLPFSKVALIFALLGLPMAFTRHLVSLALVLGILAIALGGWGTWRAHRSMDDYFPIGIKRAAWSMKLGILGVLLSTVMWLLWATNTLLR